MKKLASLLAAFAAFTISNSTFAAVELPPPTGGQEETGLGVDLGDQSAVEDRKGPRRHAEGQLPKVIITIYPLLLHLPAHPAFVAEARGEVESLYSVGTPESAVLSSLRTEHIWQPAAKDAKTLWFVVRVRSLDPAYAFSGSGLVFQGKSSDGANSLAKINQFDNPNYAYAPQALGIVWVGGGPSAADKKVESGAFVQKVNELIFVGSPSTYYLGDFSKADVYVKSFSNFSVTGTWTLYDGGEIVGLNHFTIETHPTTPPTILITRSGLIIDLRGGGLAVLESSDRLPVISWQPVTTVNVSGTVPYDSDSPKKFFRLRR